MVKLGVNVDHVATIRQARGTHYPDVVAAALVCQSAGAHGITVHLREDRRHIQLMDVETLKHKIDIPLNLEMAPTKEMLGVATRILPHEVCLVPERREELTTEGGLDVVNQTEHLSEYCAKLQDAGILVSLFIDPIARQVNAASQIGANIVELHTGLYAESGAAYLDELENLRAAAQQASVLGMIVNAGHGLNFENVGPVAGVDNMNCLNIGHAIVARALFTGLREAVQEMLSSISDVK